ncbi:hypothetical protein Prudu_020318, partial [Prunus dulcis]
ETLRNGEIDEGTSGWHGRCLEQTDASICPDRIVKMRKDLWQGFNNSLKVTLERSPENPQEWDVMDILVQYLCDDTSDSAAADPYSASYAGENRNPSAPEHLVQYLLADTSDSAAADPYSASYAEENRNPSAPEQNSCDELWSWILARATVVAQKGLQQILDAIRSKYHKTTRNQALEHRPLFAMAKGGGSALMQKLSQ